MAFIRPYRASDEDAIVHIFRETASADLVADPNPETKHVASFLWARPYIKLRPDWCWVLDDGNGLAVGYILCASDTKSFVDDYRKNFTPYATDLGIKKPEKATDLYTRLSKQVYEPEGMLQSDYPNLLSNYPAHLHIDILPTHQGAGFGQKMIATLMEKLTESDVIGVHLGTVADNHGAGRFYSRLGFQPFPDMNENGQAGRKGGAIHMVKKL